MSNAKDNERINFRRDFFEEQKESNVQYGRLEQEKHGRRIERIEPWRKGRKNGVDKYNYEKQYKIIEDAKNNRRNKKTERKRDKEKRRGKSKRAGGDR